MARQYVLFRRICGDTWTLFYLLFFFCGCCCVFLFLILAVLFHKCLVSSCKRLGAYTFFSYDLFFDLFSFLHSYKRHFSFVFLVCFLFFINSCYCWCFFLIWFELLLLYNIYMIGMCVCKSLLCFSVIVVVVAVLFIFFFYYYCYCSK